jgi:Cu-Zn family superoxide dismutase
VSESGVGADVGSVRFADGPYGLSIEPALAGLSPGLHGAHIHQNPACGPSEKDGAAVAGGAAGGHYDPKGTGRHAGPFGDGHLGDLPNLVVEAGGAATMPVVAPRLGVAALVGRALIVHGGPDRYADDRDKGGTRAYCGVIR